MLVLNASGFLVFFLRKFVFFLGLFRLKKKNDGRGGIFGWSLVLEFVEFIFILGESGWRFFFAL